MDFTQLAISVRRAQPTDAPALAALVNRAYAVEGFFVDGERTTPAEIERLVSARPGAFLVLEHNQHADAASLSTSVTSVTSVTSTTSTTAATLAAAVYVEPRCEGGYIGMLSVDPGFQGMGLGTRLVRIAEAMCEAMGATSVRLRIVNLREELGRWYRSLGYHEVGTAPYDERPVKQPCHFVEMHKPLAVADTARRSRRSDSAGFPFPDAAHAS